MRKKKDGKKVKLVRDTLYIDGEVYKGTLMDPRVDSQKNAGDRLPKKKTARARHLPQTGTRGRAAKTEISDSQCL